MSGKRQETFDAVVIGAGAAGLMTALTAGQRGKRVLVLDHNDEPGRKILISGGGRCNFTNLQTVPDRFLSQNRHFARSALARYKPADFLALVEKHRIAWHEKTLGQLFCDGSARQILAMLLDECAKGDVTIRLGETIRDVRFSDRFTVETDTLTIEAQSLVLATGGLSIPKLGATGLAHRLARQFDIPLVSPAPGLVPLQANIDDLGWMPALSGVSLPVRVQSGKTIFEEAMLFTHKGLSGPAILQISSFWKPGQSIRIDLLPEKDAFETLKNARKERSRAHAVAILSEQMPRRLAEELGPRLLGEKAAAEWPDKLLRAAAETLKNWQFTPSGTEGYAKAEVTTGGVDTKALSSRTMASTNLPQLYFVGEAVDVTGWLGGYNFQWAWASGYAAGTALSE
ncbi:NAD(P)/FAD-dependent oxidoreductase [Acetobacter sp.]|uniref:NAD(P)/FAD-dependent oxidoreductase n=1 Tax=Acetobacter sp. TaxID=440 RepID=UPI0025BA7375|nr:NAD(P)/FAD-dependent oxidoreductase [Acetobacter sp.]MCH4090932.1 NAD(P)/FAD-dependent oxidoreductase [Acetobacter sp.]MCI1300773.1 NAD(P)/FAD-dependent oxidoreductase [Acetobacter sp.]MCI1317122.1 NAD(P)/FAD-dependent oxidoreductase [Acetobacter sp.]